MARAALVAWVPNGGQMPASGQAGGNWRLEVTTASGTDVTVFQIPGWRSDVGPSAQLSILAAGLTGITVSELLTSVLFAGNQFTLFIGLKEAGSYRVVVRQPNGVAVLDSNAASPTTATGSKGTSFVVPTSTGVTLPSAADLTAAMNSGVMLGSKY